MHVHACKIYEGLCMSLSLARDGMCVHTCKPVHSCVHMDTRGCEWCLSAQGAHRPGSVWWSRLSLCGTYSSLLSMLWLRELIYARAEDSVQGQDWQKTLPWLFPSWGQQIAAVLASLTFPVGKLEREHVESRPNHGCPFCEQGLTRVLGCWYPSLLPPT